ncbi:MAG: hypothetical protein IKD30_04715 [Peptococcaceae bacterium]|nr:hypothetical protein [Peptococcaceae bacterium]
MLQTIERFNQHAVKQNLSAGAILLWQRLYITMQHKGQFADVQQNTAVLTAQLEVSRQGLQQMRQMLVDKGFLQIRMDEHQQIFYTLMIDGKTVGPDNTVGAGRPRPQSINGTGNPTPTVPSGDLILTNRIRPYIDTFCKQAGANVKLELLQWAEMRRQNGWTLTLWGLEELLKKLITLAEGKAEHMAEIIRQSVSRRWKGFFPLRRKANPSGEKLRKQEKAQDAAQSRYQKPWQKSAPVHKFKPEGRDLSFLEF